MARILVIKLGALGDFVLAFAPFAAIRARHAGDHVALLTAPPFAALARASPWFDEVLVDARPRWWDLAGLARLRQQLQGWDLVYDLQTSGRSSRYFRLAGRPAWSGIAPGCSLPHRDRTRDGMHTVERQRGQLVDAGFSDFPAPDLGWLTRGGPLVAEPYALLVPGAAPHRPAKRWPAERFGALARLLRTRGLRPVVAGTAAERPLADAIRAACPEALDLAGRTSLLELGGLAARARLAVGNDTGPMHLAASMGCPSVVLFSGDSDPLLTAPRGASVRVLREQHLADLPVERVAAALPWRHRRRSPPESRTPMPAITLPDGSSRHFEAPVTGTELAASIGPGLARAALAMAVDGDVQDLSRPIEHDASVRFITRRDAEALPLIRHDAAHVMAEAVQSLYPGTQVTIGPAIADGFYYDFARNEPFTAEDLTAIEARMREIAAANAPFTREVWDRDEAIRFFEARGERYKAEIIRDLPPSETITLYRQGEWVDLCRGPHMRATGDLGAAFKLMKVAGAYWRGDSRNAMLSRIYGTAWRDQKELDAYLHQLAEAERRDHRRIGREMDLFHFQEDAVGSAFWHPNGWRLYLTAEEYMRRRLDAAGYKEVRTPLLLDRKLWEASGHWDNFKQSMYVARVEEEDVTLAVKPMNCPCHVQIFRQGIRSYRELPLRLAEFGSCHRYEPSGALHGLMRVRAFTQDDAHIFCTEDQIAPETVEFVELLSGIYRDFGFDGFRVKLSDRPAARAGTDETWDRAEGALREACATAGVDYELNPGEGAFYGPKLEFVLRDAIGRDWQCGTLQVDFVMPERLDAEYVAEDGARRRPVMLHRAILGSFERFLGILIEQYAGRFPLWLAPVQAVVATIVSDAEPYAREVQAALKAAGLQAELDVRNEKINAKVREHSVRHVPYLVVVGRREAEQGTVALRRLGGEAQEVLPLGEAVERLAQEATPPDLARAAERRTTQHAA